MYMGDVFLWCWTGTMRTESNLGGVGIIHWSGVYLRQRGSIDHFFHLTYLGRSC